MLIKYISHVKKHIYVRTSHLYRYVSPLFILWDYHGFIYLIIKGFVVFFFFFFFVHDGQEFFTSMSLWRHVHKKVRRSFYSYASCCVTLNNHEVQLLKEETLSYRKCLLFAVITLKVYSSELNSKIMHKTHF